MRRRAPQRTTGFKRRRTQNTFQRNNRQVRRRTGSNSRSGGYLGIEYKFLDAAFGATTLTSTAWTALNPVGTGCTNSISVPALGDAESERNGKQYAITGVHLRGDIRHLGSQVSAVPFADVKVRIVMYIDTQTNGTEATGSDIMATAGSDNTLAFRNLQYSSRFKILMDRIIQIHPDETYDVTAGKYSTGGTIKHFKMNKNFKVPLKVNCKSAGSTANVSSVVDNNIGVIACCDAANWVQLEYATRVRFVG